MARWLSVAVLLAPLAIVPSSWGPTLAEAKNHAFLLLGAVTVIALVANPWVRAFAAWTLAAYLFHGAHPWALSAVAGVCVWALFYQQGATLSEAAWRKVRLAVVVAALGQVAWVGVQLAQLDPLFVPGPVQSGPPPSTVQPHGWFGNPMDLALFLGLALPLCAAVHPALAGLVALVILVVLPTTVGAVAVAVTAVWLGWRYLRSWMARGTLVAAVAGAGLVYVLVADPQGAGSRPAIWLQTLHHIGQRPLAGWGPNALDHRVILMTPRTELRWNFVFNEWLQAWLELGLVAPALAIGYLVTLLRRLRDRVVEMAELAPALAFLLLASLFSIPLRIGPVALAAALVLGQMERRLA